MAIDLTPHRFVAGLAKGFEQQVQAFAIPKVQGQTPDQDAAQALVDNTNPDLVAFAGFVGGKVNDGNNVWQLLYLDWRLWTWLLAPEKQIYYRDRIKDDSAPGGERDVIWVDATALVKRGSGPRGPLKPADRFLRGEFTSAGDISASLTGGTFTPATGIFCEATTPSCCGKPTKK